MQDLNLIQKRDCDSFCFELVKRERKEIIIQNNLSDIWEKEAACFYPNSIIGEVYNVLKIS